jgi:hypothetical protein
MTSYEYKTLPAPRRERRVRGQKAGADAFAAAIQAVLNDQAAAGWEFQRAESLPCDEKKGFLGRRQEVLHTLLIFRRAIPAPVQAAEVLRAEPPAPAPVRAEPARAEPAPEPAFNVLD